MRIFELPLNSKKEVLNVLPTLFEEFIDIENKKFYVKKISDNRYLAFAYDDIKILETIKNSKLNIGQINNIHFAQLEFDSLYNKQENASFIVNNQLYSYIDDVLVKVPASLDIPNKIKVDLKKLNLSKDTIYVNSSSKYIDSKSAYTISILFMIFALLTFGKYYSNLQIINDTPIKVDQIKTEAKMLTTSLQTKSVIKKLKKISTKQLRLREIVEYTLLFRKSSKGVLLSVDYKNNKFIFKFKDISSKKIKKYLEKKYSLDSISQKDNIVTIGLTV